MPPIAQFLLGLLLLLLGGDSLLRGAAGLSQRLGLSPFATGLLLVSFATSLPELVVNAWAVQQGASDLALGNAVGSNIVNIGLTLGLAALVAPVAGTMRLLAGEVVFLLVATGMVLLFGLDRAIARWEGGLLLAGFVSALAYVFSRGRQEAPEVRKEIEEFAETSTGLAQNLARIAIAGALLWFGGRWVVQGAPALGLMLGLGTMMTGLTLVAIGTALPEVVLAVLGASLFNLLVVVGGMAVARPLAIPASFAQFELPAAMAFALLLVPILGGDLRASRREGVVLLAGFAAWLVFELYTAVH